MTLYLRSCHARYGYSLPGVDVIRIANSQVIKNATIVLVTLCSIIVPYSAEDIENIKCLNDMGDLVKVSDSQDDTA